MPARSLLHPGSLRAADTWVTRAPGLRVAVGALVLAVVALAVAWVGASRGPVDGEPSAAAETAGGGTR